MENRKIYDFIGIGIGPFGLGLAALSDQVKGMEALFFEQHFKFDWHPGMLIDGTDLQVPFLADLVTAADPTSPYSFLNYLHEQGRLSSYYLFRKFNIPRKEYNRYAQWAAGSLDQCLFGRRVEDVIYHEAEENPFYEVKVFNREDRETECYHARHMVLGTGSIPNIPEGFEEGQETDVFHTSEYLFREPSLKKGNTITVIGSGQSAAEVFYDLLQDQQRCGYQLSWFTRSSGIFQLESAKMAQEMFSAEYVEYFHRLSFEQRIEALSTFSQLRKGVEPETLNLIYDLLYERTIDQDESPVTIQPLTEATGIESIDKGYRLTLHQWQEGHTFTHDTEKVILATGYKPDIPEWVDRFKDELVWEDEKRFKVTQDYRLVFKKERPNAFFTLTNLEHSHGTGATNLWLSVKRNQKIVNSIAGRDIYPVEKDKMFQQFSQRFENTP
ncbi:MAG TPA: SidA/IucD/PvdA family monooxygenase [Bacillales bacterium]|nr:SidA/IucD/PvdA family monooxygenase [Bacillales bacterium]